MIGLRVVADDGGVDKKRQEGVLMGSIVVFLIKRWCSSHYFVGQNWTGSIEKPWLILTRWRYWVGALSHGSAHNKQKRWRRPFE